MTIQHFMEVLLVEDRKEDAELTMRALKKNHLINEIKWIDDGQDALDYLFGNGNYLDKTYDLPKLILLDLKLPKVNGLEILEKLKSHETLKQIPVVILTSSQEDVDIQKAYRMGVNSYIVKPIDFSKFAEAIKQVGIYWLMMNESPTKNSHA